MRSLSEFENINLDRIPEWQLGWLAGMIDGEGCLSIHKLGTPKVVIVSTMPIGDVLTWMVGFGSFTIIDNGVGHKNLYNWHVTSVAGVYTLLSKLSPFLLMKRKQCDLMLEYCKGRLEDNLSKPREWYYDEMKELNKKGVDE